MGEAAGEHHSEWDDRAATWERRANALQAFPDTYGTPAIDALGPAPGDRVLDIGCGPGLTALDLATRVGVDGEVVGVDISEGMVAAATRRAAAAGAGNVRFLVADAQTADLGTDLDGAFSRFGVMFFDDPAAAFANIARALRPGGRLACVVWGPIADNPWMRAPAMAAGPVLGAEPDLPVPGVAGPFAFSDPDRLAAAVGGGFADVEIERIGGMRFVPAAIVDEEIRSLLELGPVRAAFGAADEPARKRAVEAVIAAIEPYRDGDLWRIPGAAFVVTGRAARR